jgi:methyltransferase
VTRLLGLETRALYLGVLGLVVVQRLAELALARRNARRLLARGGVEAGGGHYPVMVAFHAAFLLACPLEVFLLRRPFLPALAAVMAALLLGAAGLRTWAISSLGPRWTTRVIVVPGEEPVAAGPYRWIRHPNYLAVVVEVAALPLLHTAWATALAASAGNALLLSARVKAEEAALAGTSSYGAVFAARPRFLPTGRGRA